ncbi:MAG TPA: tetratricopeptide repeat protein [Bacteroidales bacterium]|jgi:tetratricopeptide (TPR) repeat protein|nr:tetratricopeptide repeat protein [Bacteroidales bacterium]
MNNRIFLYFFLLFYFLMILPTTLSAVNNEELMKQANEAYQAKKYNEAVNLYLQIVNNGNEGAVLYYNLGNAYYKCKEPAKAVLWYERALRLSPNNEDIQHNIAFVNQSFVDKIDVLPSLFLVRWWNSLSHSQTSRNWAILSIVFSFLFFASLIGILFSQKKWLRSLSLLLSFIFLFTLILSIIFANREKNRWNDVPEAIVMQSVVSVKSSPDNSSNDLFVIHEGLKIKVTDRLQDWIEIKIPSGERGWIQVKNIEII